MHAALLVCLLGADPIAELRPVATPGTLSLALERSQTLAEQLLEALPDNVPNSPRSRIKMILADVRRDSARVARDGKNAIFEASVFVHYGQLCQLALEHLGPERLKFKPVRDDVHGDVKVGSGKSAKVTFADTLFVFEDLHAIGVKAHELLEALDKKEKLDAYQTARWKRDLAQVRTDLKNAEEEVRSPAQVNRISPEAKLLAVYAKAVSLTVNFDK